MKKSLVISEQDSIAAILENDRAVEFFVNRGELLLGDIYTATVENILPGIDAAFVNLGKDKMGFLHANDVPGQGPLKERLVPKQKLLVQITKEPTGHKGPRVSTAISLPGRFLVLVPEERGVSISRRISETRERSRLKSVVNLMKPPGVGLIIRTEAKGQGENELFEDFEQLWDRWQTVVSDGEASIGPTLIYRDQDLLFRVIRDAYSHDVVEIVVDTLDGQRRAQEYLAGWASKLTKISCHAGEEGLLVSKGIDREIEAALSDRVELPSGGHLNIEPTEALTVIDVNSGRFTSSRTQAETVRRTNLEAAQEISRQLRLRNIGGMVIVDFIDMDSRKDQQQVLEVFQRTLEEDRAKPQIGQLSDLGLVELTRRRQGQSLRELFTVHCETCSGLGFIPTLELGPVESRKVISLKGKDADSIARAGKNASRRLAKSAGTVLRAATASNGRILPTVEESVGEIQDFEETLASLPEHILEQMPDDLLVDKPSSKRGFPHDDEGEGEGSVDHHVDDELEDLNVPGSLNYKESRHPSAFDGDGEETSSKLADGLLDSISAVAKVFHEFDRAENPRSYEKSPYERTFVADASEREISAEVESADVEVESAPAEASNSFVSPSYKQMEHEQEEQEQEVSEAAPESPFETEIDPVTGIYRLKVKPEHAHYGDDEFGSPAQESSSHSSDGQTTAPETGDATRLDAAKSIFQATYAENQPISFESMKRESLQDASSATRPNFVLSSTSTEDTGFASFNGAPFGGFAETSSSHEASSEGEGQNDKSRDAEQSKEHYQQLKLPTSDDS